MVDYLEVPGRQTASLAHNQITLKLNTVDTVQYSTLVAMKSKIVVLSYAPLLWGKCNYCQRYWQRQFTTQRSYIAHQHAPNYLQLN